MMQQWNQFLLLESVLLFYSLGLRNLLTYLSGTHIQIFKVLSFTPDEHQELWNVKQNRHCEDPTTNLQNQTLQGEKPGYLNFLNAA